MLRTAISMGGTDGGQSGIGCYVRNLLPYFATLNREREWDVFVRNEDRSTLVPTAECMRLRSVPAATRRPLVDLAWHQLVLPRRCRQESYSALFLPAANRRVPARVTCPTVGTVHDLAPLSVEGKYDPLRQYYVRRVLPALVRRLTHIITVSEHSKRDILRYTGVPEKRVTVIPNGVDHERFRPGSRPAAQSEVQSRFGVERPYILYVARLEHPAKSHVRLIREFNHFKQRTRAPHILLLAGSAWTRAAEIYREAEASPFRQDIVFPGFVHASSLPDLYRGAELFVFPSSYEGFGLPVLEAMACGTPVACANVASLPEVGGNAVRYFSPESNHDIALAMEELLTDRAYRDRCITRGFSQARRFTWRRTAEHTLEVLHDAERIS